MSTKLAADESNVENVSIKNRPMNVAEEYQLLCSNQWLDAKTILDDLGDSRTPDYMKVQILSEVLMVIFMIFVLIFTKFVHNLFVSIFIPKTPVTMC